MNDTPEPPDAPRQHEPARRALLDYNDPPVEMLFVYNCNPLATMPDQNRVLRGLAARRPVHRRLRAGLHRHRALRRRRAAGDDVPRELRHRQGLRPDQPAAGAAGDRAGRRGAAERGGVLGARQRGSASARPKTETDTLLRIAGRLPDGVGAELMEHGVGDAAVRRRAGPVRRRLSADAGSEDRPVPGGARSRGARRALRLSSRIPATEQLPAGADLAGEREDHLVDARRAARARRRCCRCIPSDAAERGTRARTTRSASSTTSAKCTARSR